MKIGIVISDGVGYRNFVLSDFMQNAKTHFDEIIIYSFLPAKAYKDLPENCYVIELDVFSERRITWLLRKFKEIAHLTRNKQDNFGIQDNYEVNKSKSNSFKGLLIRIIYIITRIFNTETIISLFEKLQFSSFKKDKLLKEYNAILFKDRPDLLFFTHQRPPFIAPLISIARRLKIKTATFIFSWDNLASKGRMAGTFDEYLVWSNLMKEELLQFYPLTKSQSIHVVGTPQFVPYVLDKYRMSKVEFFDWFGLDNKLPVILFTCNDSSSKNDPIYLDTIADFIKSGDIRANLIVRTSPAEDPDRFLHLASKYPFIKWNYPEWILTRNQHPELWTQRVPTFKDINLLKHLLKYSDLVVNVLSTITLDACLFNKPVINPVFGNEQNGLYNDQKFLRYKHLTHMLESKCSVIVKNEDEFLNAINDCIQNPERYSSGRQNLVDLEIGAPLESTCQLLTNALFQICKA